MTVTVATYVAIVKQVCIPYIFIWLHVQRYSDCILKSILWILVQIQAIMNQVQTTNRNLIEVLEELKYVRTAVDRLSTANPSTTSQSKANFKLPLKTLEEVKDIEEMLKDVNLQSILVSSKVLCNMCTYFTFLISSLIHFLFQIIFFRKKNCWSRVAHLWCQRWMPCATS